jgi:isopropylmalate/homocitrate/citramalate synthase
MSYKFTKDELKNLLIDFNSFENVLPEDKPSKVCIWDETLRDGEQSPAVFLTLDEKIHLSKLLDEIGIKIIAAGYPAVSKSEKLIVKTLMKENHNNASILAIARPKKEEIDVCIECDAKEIVIFMPISPFFMKILKHTEEQELSIIENAITHAKDHGLKINWVSEDCTRAKLEHIFNVFNIAISAGAERIVIGDTVGVLTPYSTKFLVHQVMDNVLKSNKRNGIELGIHCHDDFGLAVANTITGVFEGCTYPHTCVNGYGERAGNAALEEVVLILERNGIDTGIKMEKLMELSEITEKYFCQPLALNKAIVGQYAFSHESGLHIAGILAHPLSYEPINPKIIGRRRKFYLGKGSGSSSVINAIKEKIRVLDLDIPDEIIKKIVAGVKVAHEESSKEDVQKSFRKIKKELNKISMGVSDKEFFDIVNKYAQPYVPDDFKPKKKK